MDKEAAKIKDDMIEDEEEGDEEGEEKLTPEQLDEGLLKACKENNYDEALFFLQNHASPTCQDKEGWNPLLWAACNGNEQIVRLLIKHNACAPYLNQNQEDLALAAAQKNLQANVGGDEVYDPFVKPKDA
jgi:ankyrin repeat protein